jgi:hypothetical protein
MFRTRDFLFIFVTVVFLVIAIGVTLTREYFDADGVATVVTYVETTDQEYFAELDEKVPHSREEQLVEMRRKIAEAGALNLLPPETTVVAVAEEEEVEEEFAVSQTDVQKCPGYANYSGYWSPQGVQIELSEGARIVYRATEQATISTSTAARDILMQLPAYPIRAGSSCLPSDVVGVAQDGSLIRNTEVGLYGVFGEHTLIGYAIDGFPIYGVSGAKTDACGGVVIAGEYRYNLSDDRESILNCFAATPVRL